MKRNAPQRKPTPKTATPDPRTKDRKAETIRALADSQLEDASGATMAACCCRICM